MFFYVDKKFDSTGLRNRKSAITQDQQPSVNTKGWKSGILRCQKNTITWKACFNIKSDMFQKGTN